MHEKKLGLGGAQGYVQGWDSPIKNHKPKPRHKWRAAYSAVVRFRPVATAQPTVL